MRPREPKYIEAIRCSLDHYFSVAITTVQLLTQEWTTVSPTEWEAIRQNAEEHASDNAGPKMTQVSIALDRLLDTVADVTKERCDEGRKAIQQLGPLRVGGCLFSGLLDLFPIRQRGVAPRPGDV